MKKTILIISFLLCLLFLHGQNLVQNPSFEELAGNPGNGHIPVNGSKNWYCPNFSGTDYFVRIDGVGEGVPKNEYGIQAPHSGNAYAGICIHKDYIEYVGTKLAKPLVAKKTTLLNFIFAGRKNPLPLLKSLAFYLLKSLTRRLIRKDLLCNRALNS